MAGMRITHLVEKSATGVYRNGPCPAQLDAPRDAPAVLRAHQVEGLQDHQRDGPRTNVLLGLGCHSTGLPTGECHTSFWEATGDRRVLVEIGVRRADLRHSWTRIAPRLKTTPRTLRSGAFELLRENAKSKIREMWRKLARPVTFFARHSLLTFRASCRRSEFADSLGNGAPGRNRTCDPRLRRPMLYPLSYGRADLIVRATRADECARFLDVPIRVF